MSDHILWPIIAKYLAGECSPEEMSFMESWLEREENHQLFQQLESAWRNQQVSGEHHAFDVSRGLNLLNSKIELQETDGGLAKLSIGVNTWFAAASAVLILGMTFNFYKKRLTRPETAVAMIQKVTGTREMIKVELPDHSIVWLNKKSVLEYPESFEGSERMVTLTGDAYFEVSHNKEKPFIVKSNGIATRVLGTSFEVKSYPGDKATEVAVRTGKVKVSVSRDEVSPANNNPLTPGQKLVVDNEKSNSYIETVSLKSIAHWRLDPLIFRDNTYKEVADQLEMRFEKKIVFKNENLKKCRVMASFNRDATLDDILKLLSISNSFEYIVGAKQVTISGGVCH